MSIKQEIFEKEIIALAMHVIKNISGGKRWKDPEIQARFDLAIDEIYTDEERDFERQAIAEYYEVMEKRFITPFTSEADIIHAVPELPNKLLTVADNQARIVTAVFGNFTTQMLLPIDRLTPEIQSFLKDNGFDVLADACSRTIKEPEASVSQLQIVCAPKPARL